MTTLVTAAQIATLRRMVAEPTTTTYSDALLTTFIETYPHMDEQGEEPYSLSSAQPPAQVANPNWIPTYDLNAAAGDVWQEKASGWADKYDFAADGGNYSRSQGYEQAMKQARYFRARRMPTSARAHKWPNELDNRTDSIWIGNLPESDD